MRDTLLKHLLPVTMLLLVNFSASAASATATVSANIVPNTALFMTGSIVLNNDFDNYKDKTQTKLNNASIVTSTLHNKDSAKIKIKASHNANYDISISPSSPVINNMSEQIKITRLQTSNTFNAQNNDDYQELVIEAIMDDIDTNDTGTYFGTVEINVNYN